MSKRLQVVLNDEEHAELARIAEEEGLTLSDWVRRNLRGAVRRAPARDRDRKLAVVRSAVAHSYPTADIEQMVGEIEVGYQM